MSKIIRICFCFCFTSFFVWLTKFAPFSRANKQTKTNPRMHTCIFPRLALGACNYFKFWLVHGALCISCGWSVTALVLVLRQSIESHSNSIIVYRNENFISNFYFEIEIKTLSFLWKYQLAFRKLHETALSPGHRSWLKHGARWLAELSSLALPVSRLSPTKCNDAWGQSSSLKICQ